jgi:hypothetical protein
MKHFLYLILALTILSQGACARKGPTIRESPLDENRALDYIAHEVYHQHDRLQGKKIGIFNFTTIDGKDILHGKVLAQKLLEKLMSRGELQFIERAEIDKILKAQGFEQTGIVDRQTVKESGTMLTIDVMISGTIAGNDTCGELSVKAVNISSGEIYMTSRVKFLPSRPLPTEKNPALLSLYRKSPKILDALNRTFFILGKLKKERPLIFLLAVLDRDDIDMVRKHNPFLSVALKKRKNAIERNPRMRRRIIQLRKGVKLLKEHDPQRYKSITAGKIEIIQRPVTNP